MEDPSVKEWRELFEKPSVPSSNLILTIEANVDNEKLSDEEFREFVRKSLTICEEVIESKTTLVWRDCDHCKGRGCHWCGNVGKLPDRVPNEDV